MINKQSLYFIALVSAATILMLTSIVGAVPVPIVSNVNPNSGTDAGGNYVLITGSGLTGATAVNFGTTAATFTFFSDSIVATLPAGTDGTVDVTVTTPGGTSATSSADQFTYIPVPTVSPIVSSISPTSGTDAGGNSVTITGSGFTGATAVNFGSNSATYIVNSDSSIIATSPAGTDGTVDVTVTTLGGTSATSSADQYTYTAPDSTDNEEHNGDRDNYGEPGYGCYGGYGGAIVPVPMYGSPTYSSPMYSSPMYGSEPSGTTETPKSDSNGHKAKAHLSKHKHKNHSKHHTTKHHKIGKKSLKIKVDQKL